MLFPLVVLILLPQFVDIALSFAVVADGIFEDVASVDAAALSFSVVVAGGVDSVASVCLSCSFVCCYYCWWS